MKTIYRDSWRYKLWMKILRKDFYFNSDFADWNCYWEERSKNSYRSEEDKLTEDQLLEFAIPKTSCKFNWGLLLFFFLQLFLMCAFAVIGATVALAVLIAVPAYFWINFAFHNFIPEHEIQNGIMGTGVDIIFLIAYSVVRGNIVYYNSEKPRNFYDKFLIFVIKTFVKIGKFLNHPVEANFKAVRKIGNWIVEKYSKYCESIEIKDRE